MSEKIEIIDELLKSVHKSLGSLIAEVLRPEAYPQPVMHIMRHVHRHPGSTVSEIARRTGIAKSNVSTVVEDLAGEGLLNKQPDERDRRLVRIYPTQKADEFFRQHQLLIRHRLEEVFASVPSQKLDEIIDGLTLLKTTLDQQTSTTAERR